jgi:S-methylmethionine-dependent homocysteine/selenocysteine methylase
MTTLLDGPVGTELERRGLELPPPLWSARAIDDAPKLLREIHADYAAAGARVHTANTFRTDSWTLRKVGREDESDRLTREAVEIVRSAVPQDHWVAGSLSPLEDCYEPARSPSLAVCRDVHSASARSLVSAGVDVLLCESFPHPGEALAAVDSALEHNVPVWLSLTPGPGGDLLTKERLVETLREAARRGVEAVMVNCAPLNFITDLLPLLMTLDVDWGAYGNVFGAGEVAASVPRRQDTVEHFLDAARLWLEAGASIVGGCCGAGPEDIKRLSELAKKMKKPVESV